jgi:hypothetical protein
MGVVLSPWLDRHNEIAQWGFSCKGCRDCDSRQLDWKECTRKLTTLSISALATSHYEL